MATKKNAEGYQEKVHGEAEEELPQKKSGKVEAKRKLYYGGRHSRTINPGEKREEFLAGKEIKIHRKPDKK